jgi:type II secretory pathway component PulF
MAIYFYRALDQAKKMVRGEIAGESERHARSLLRDSGLTPVSLVVTAGARRRTPSLDRIAVFARQFGTLLKAGFPVDRALGAISNSSSDAAMRALVTAIEDGVRRGQPLSESLRKSAGEAGGRGVLEELAAMAEAGEASGELATTLLGFAELLERRLAFRRRVRGALFYPLIVALLACAVVVFLFIHVIPTVTRLFDGTGMPLPLPTRILFVVSAWTQSLFWFVAGGALLLILFWRRILGSRAVRIRIENTLRRLPGLGPILDQAALARWARGFGSLLSSGVEIRQAMEITGRTAASLRMEEAMRRARTRVAEGVTLSRALTETGAFPRIALETVSVGEQANALPGMLLEMAAAWEAEVESSAERFADLLEPAVLVVMGFLVGGIVLAILLPIFEFNTGIR